jgi:hypothetical protein
MMQRRNVVYLVSGAALCVSRLLLELSYRCRIPLDPAVIIAWDLVRGGVAEEED